MRVQAGGAKVSFRSRPGVVPNARQAAATAGSGRRSRRNGGLGWERQQQAGRERRLSLHLVGRVAGDLGPSKVEDDSSSKKQEENFKISLDNAASDKFTVVTLEVEDKPGLMTVLSSTFHDMNLNVERAEYVADVGIKFWIADENDAKISDAEDASNIKQYLTMVVKKLVRGSAKARPYALSMSDSNDMLSEKKDLNRSLLYGLLDSYLKNDVLSIQESIVHHVEFTLARSRYKFDSREAYFAAAHSLRDRLIERWNDTQAWLRHKDPKRVYYLSMEFLMGRTFLNALSNLGVITQYREALDGLGYDMEKVQVCIVSIYGVSSSTSIQFQMFENAFALLSFFLFPSY
jgi:hypothetical protein